MNGHSLERSKDTTICLVIWICVGVASVVNANAVESSEGQLIGINNTGISLPYNSFGLISSMNLSYGLNTESDVSQYIKYEMTRESPFGSVQKLRANGFWANVTSFSQRQVNRNKIRYFHYKDKPNEDILELQVSYSQLKIPSVRFRIEFTKSKLEAITLNQLTISPDMDQIPITSKELQFDTRPIPTNPNLIVYTILSKPTFGSLYLTSGNISEDLGVGSLVTQQMVNELRLHYNCSDKQSLKWKNHDSFDFEVATEGGMTNVEVTSFHLKLIRGTDEEFILTNKKLVVIEGDRATISDKVLAVESNNKIGFLHFNITNKPKFGTIKLMNHQLNDVIQVSPNIITEEEISQNRIVYNHDDSEHNRDLFDFEVFDSQNNFICFGTFIIEIVMKNDNPPIRVVDKVFEVVTDGQKRLTANDIKYIDADMDSTPSDIKYSKTYIPNGNLYFVDRPTEVVEMFTQEDIDKEKILFRHKGDEFGRSILWISDGQFYASGVLEIKASKPYVKVLKNTGLIVKYGESGLISRENLTVETNLDIQRKSDVTIKVTSEPKFGQLLNAGKETNRFNLQDLVDESIEYECRNSDDNSTVIYDSFTFRLFYNGEDYLSSRTTAENQVFNITIYPHSYFQLSVINLKNISAEEDQFAVIDSSSLLVSHPSLSADQIVYMITELPKLGALSLLTHNTTPVPMHFPSKESFNRNENLLIFTQKDIDDNLIHYKYFSQNKSFFEDHFKFDVSNGITTLRNFTLHVNIISKLITLYTGNITVTEGQSVALIPDDFIASNAFYANMIDEYLIIEEPKFGKIVCKDQNDEIKVIKSFTPQLLKDGLISYSHDGSESVRDWLTVVVRANSINKESLPATIHVIIDPINDEKPYVVNNTGLELWEGSSAIITNSHLAAVDDDSENEDIFYHIQTPSNGYLATVDNRLVPIEKFSQIMINSGIILFVQRGELSGGFRFQVTDGSLWSPQHAFVVNAKPVVMSMIVNKKLRVFPQMQQSVTRDHLLVETNDDNSTRQFVYNVIKEPKYGRFLLENSDGTTKHTSSFTQKQIDENLVLFEQNKPINDLLVEDQIIFDIESHFVKPLKGISFSVIITIGNAAQDITSEMTQLIETSPMTVIEGQFSVISEDNFNISQLIQYWEKRNFNTKIVEKFHIKIQRTAVHGSVLFEGHEVGVSVKSVPLNALSTNQLIYKHDGTNTLNDSLVLSIYVRNGIDVLLSNHTIEIIIIPVNDEPPVLLTANPRIQVIYDSKTLISSSHLKTRARDGLSNNILYELLIDPIISSTFGFFMIEPNEEPVDSFTQTQIDSNLVYFNHKGLTTDEKQIQFRVKDKKSICPANKWCAQLHSVTLVTRMSTLKLYNHTNVQLLQGSITTNIEPKHLSVVSNDIRPEDIMFYVREPPVNGYIIVDDKTNNERFRQSDVNSLKVSYIQINKTSKDFFIVDIMGLQREQIRKTIKNVTISIVVKPLVRAKRPFLIASPGKRSLITTEHLDASELAAITISVPKFKIKTNPKFGVLKKFISEKENNSREKRKTSYKLLTEFTNEDILKNRIAYIADHNLDLSVFYPNEVLTDVIGYELSAHNVPTASGVLVVNIFDNKLIDKLYNKDLGLNISDLDDQEIEFYETDNEMNYLKILITRDHLLIGFVFVVVVILTVALIVIIRFCHSSTTNQTIHKNSKSGPIAARLGTSPAILETPTISDYGTEMLAFSHRLSPRSTPSVSEADTGIMPMAPPTSPSLSTNCSVVDNRSRTATPRSLLRLPMVGRLRGGCAAIDDMSPQSLNTSNIFPLPPPSLYFENDSNVSPTNEWTHNSVPLYKVTSAVPRCLDSHYNCTSYSNNLCPFSPNNHNNNIDIRVLGDGTSLVSSPVPSLRRTLWNTQDLHSPTLSAESWAEPSLSMNNVINYEGLKSAALHNSSDAYMSNDLDEEGLPLQQDSGQNGLNQKQHYWV